MRLGVHIYVFGAKYIRHTGEQYRPYKASRPSALIVSGFLAQNHGGEWKKH